MREYVDYAVQQAVSLCGIPSPSGFTRRAEEYAYDCFKSMGYEPAFTHKRALLVDLGGEGEGLVLAAHLDTLGAMVRSIKPNGRLRLSRIGHFPEGYIKGENCTVFARKGREYSGTIQLEKSAVHVHSLKVLSDPRRNRINLEVVLDEKVATKDDVKRLEICAGDFVAFDPRTTVTGSGFIKSRHLDDKASCAILMSLAKYVAECRAALRRRLFLMLTTYEEVGHGGSAGIPEGITEMISVDMGAVGDDLETDEFKVSICAMDSKGPYDYDVTNRLIALARARGLNHAVDLYPHYGSDVDTTLVAGYDLKHGLIGPGISASHGYERTHREGIENTLLLLREYVVS